MKPEEEKSNNSSPSDDKKETAGVANAARGSKSAKGGNSRGGARKAKAKAGQNQRGRGGAKAAKSNSNPNEETLGELKNKIRGELGEEVREEASELEDKAREDVEKLARDLDEKIDALAGDMSDDFNKTRKDLRSKGFIPDTDNPVSRNPDDFSIDVPPREPDPDGDGLYIPKDPANALSSANTPKNNVSIDELQKEVGSELGVDLARDVEEARDSIEDETEDAMEELEKKADAISRSMGVTKRRTIGGGKKDSEKDKAAQDKRQSTDGEEASAEDESLETSDEKIERALAGRELDAAKQDENNDKESGAGATGASGATAGSWAESIGKSADGSWGDGANGQGRLHTNNEGLDEMTDANENKEHIDDDVKKEDEIKKEDNLTESGAMKADADEVAKDGASSSDDASETSTASTSSSHTSTSSSSYTTSAYSSRDEDSKDSSDSSDDSTYSTSASKDAPKKKSSMTGTLTLLALVALVGGGGWYYQTHMKGQGADSASFAPSSTGTGATTSSGVDSSSTDSGEAMGETSNGALAGGDAADASMGADSANSQIVPGAGDATDEAGSSEGQADGSMGAGSTSGDLAHGSDSRANEGSGLASSDVPGWGGKVDESHVGGERLVNGNLVASIQPSSINQAGPEYGKLKAEIESNKEQLDVLAKKYHSLKSNNMEWLVTEVEATLNIVSQQLMLSGNVQQAAGTLENLERRLNRFDSPYLINLKKAVSEDVTQLKKQNMVDVVGVALRIDRLRSTLDTLPLVMDSALKVEKQNNAIAQSQADESFINGIYTDVKRSLKGLVKIRKLDNQDAMLLSPEQSFYIRQNLKLRLLDARIALLQKHNELYHDDLYTAQAEVNRYFDVKAPVVVNWLQELDALSKIRFESPDLTLLTKSFKAVEDLKAKLDIDDENTLNVIKDGATTAIPQEATEPAKKPLEVPIGADAGKADEKAADAQAAPKTESQEGQAQAQDGAAEDADKAKEGGE